MSTVYLLDTNAVTAAVRNPRGPVALGIRRRGANIVTSVMVESEIRYGLAKNLHSNVGHRVRRFIDGMTVLTFDSDAAHHYGEIRAALESRGETIDALDMLIAAHTRSLKACLITDNVRHFERVPGLTWENWQRND